LTQGELADGEVTVGYISRIEAGQRRPDLTLLRKLAARLETKPRELLTGEPSDIADRCEFSLRSAEFLLESGDARHALTAIDELVSTEALQDLPRIRAEARFVRARALEAGGDYDGAIDELERVCSDEHHARWLPALIALSRCYRESGDFGNAIEVGERVRGRLVELGLEDSDEAIQLEVTVGFAYYARGDVGQAIRLARRTIERVDRRGSPVARAAAYWNASIYEASRGAQAAAVPLAQRALALLGEGEDSRNLARLRAQLGGMLLNQEPPEVAEAEQYLQQAATDLRASSASVTDVARCELDIARARFFRGDATEARALAEKTLEMASGKAPKLEASALTLLGQLAHRNGDGPRANDLYRKAVRVLTSVGADRGVAQAWLELASLLEEVGDDAAALQAYRSVAAAAGLQIPIQARSRLGAAR
jgi:tetratricopeptide (TPR) repeat protein